MINLQRARSSHPPLRCRWTPWSDQARCTGKRLAPGRRRTRRQGLGRSSARALRLVSSSLQFFSFPASLSKVFNNLFAFVLRLGQLCSSFLVFLLSLGELSHGVVPLLDGDQAQENMEANQQDQEEVEAQMEDFNYLAPD